MNRRLWLAISIIAILSLLLASCQPQAAATEAKKVKVGLITPNPLGDRSFIDASARGIEKANSELPVKRDIIETNGVAEHETALRGAIAQDYDLVLGLAMDTEMFTNLANEFPDQKFASPSEIFLEGGCGNLRHGQ